MAYYAKITNIGLTRLAQAHALGIPLIFTDFAVGDGGGAPITPLPTMTALVNERWRDSVNNVDVSPAAPHTVRVEGLIPAASGGWYIREAGAFNGAGELIVIASFPPTYKPTPAEGATVDEYIRILFEYAHTDAVALSIDPAVIMATREYVEDLTAGGLWLQQNFT